MRSASASVAVCLILASCGGAGSTSTTPPTPTLLISVPSGPIRSGTSVQASASITDGSGTTPASNVTWSTNNSNVATVSSSGLITGAVAGAARIIASSGSLHGELQVVVVPGDPAKIVIYAGDAQNGSIGGQLPAPLCTNVKDAAGNLLVGAIVTYTVATGGGRIADPTAPPTNNEGISISGTWTLGPNAGLQTVTASSPGAGTVTFIATAR